MTDRFLKAATYGLARGPSLLFLSLFFAATAYVIAADLPVAWLIPFALLALAVMSVMVWDTFKNRYVLQEAWGERIDTDGLGVPRLRNHVRRAIEYRSALRRAILERDPDTADLSAIEEAAVLVHRLCHSIQRYEQDKLLAQDRRLLERHPSPTAGQQRQLQTLQALARQMEEAEEQAVDLLATLGESYAALQHLKAVPEADGAAPDALARLRSGADRLRDAVQAFEELYQETRPASSESAR